MLGCRDFDRCRNYNLDGTCYWLIGYFNPKRPLFIVLPKSRHSVIAGSSANLIRIRARSNIFFKKLYLIKIIFRGI
jgi:hypothetical protein